MEIVKQEPLLLYVLFKEAAVSAGVTLWVAVNRTEQPEQLMDV